MGTDALSRMGVRVAALALALVAAGCAADVGEGGEVGGPPATPSDDACTEAMCVRAGRCEPGRASSQFRAQTALPETVSPYARLPMSVTFTNCSGISWLPESFALVSSDPDDGAPWGVRRVGLAREVPPGAEVTLRFELQAPVATGRYAASWAIAHEGVEMFQEHSPAQSVQVLAPADCALAGAPVRFRTQTAPPEFLAVGQRVQASVTFANCGTTPLARADGWSLASRADPDTTWGPRRVELPTDVPPGAEVTVPLDVVAPDRPGRYDFSWQIVHDDAGVGEASPVVSPVVLLPADCDGASTPARFVRETAPPDTLDPGQLVDVGVTFANCGDRTWDASYRVDSALADGAHLWDAGPVSLALPVGAGFAIEVPFRVRAPGAPGRYPYRWAVTGPGGRLDEASPAHDLAVRCIPRCGDHNCGGDGCGGSCGACGGGASCDGAHCQLPDRPVCGELQWWNSGLTYEHISSGWHDTDLNVRSGTRVQLRHTSRLERTGVYGWGYMPEFTDLATGARYRLLHLRPQNQWATDVGRVYPAGYVVGLSGGDTRDTGLGTWSTGQHLCVQTLWTYRAAFPRGDDACR